MVKPVRIWPAPKSMEPIVQASVSIFRTAGLMAGVRAFPDFSLSRLRVSSAASRDLSTPNAARCSAKSPSANPAASSGSARLQCRSGCGRGRGQRPPSRVERAGSFSFPISDFRFGPSVPPLLRLRIVSPGSRSELGRRISARKPIRAAGRSSSAPTSQRGTSSRFRMSLTSKSIHRWKRTSSSA